MLITIAIAIIATQWRFHFDFTRSGIHYRWHRVDWHWFPRTPRGHVRIDRDLVLNLLMLVPLGIGYSMWRRASSWRVVGEALVLGILVSGALELGQLANLYRYTSFADVWRNAFGCMAGALVEVALRRASRISATTSAS
jgi:hypothetical protein